MRSPLEPDPIVVLGNGEQAEKVVDAMKALINVYGVVSRGDLYQLVALTPTHNDYKVGWESLDEVQIIYKNGEFILDLPPAVSLH